MFKKIVRAKFSDGSSTEHEGEGFKDIYEQYSGKDVDLILEKWEQSKTGIGFEFKTAAPIGNCSIYLCHNDYWRAYDKIV